MISKHVATISSLISFLNRLIHIGLVWTVEPEGDRTVDPEGECTVEPVGDREVEPEGDRRVDPEIDLMLLLLVSLQKGCLDFMCLTDDSLKSEAYSHMEHLNLGIRLKTLN